MDFTAVDVETANANMGSICQVGLAVVRGGRIETVVSRLIDPGDFFAPANVGIHGITADDVVGHPKFPDFLPKIREIFDEFPVVSHTYFDRAALDRACEACSLASFANPWIDSCTVARRCWPDQFGKSGYGLKNIATNFGIEFRHHDAGEDARVAANIILKAAETGTFDLVSWAQHRPPKRNSYQRFEQPVKIDGNPDGPLHGLRVVFTGTLSIPRIEAAKRAAVIGLSVGKSVTKKTSILVIGNQDTRKPEWGAKSSKQRRAEELISQGHDILLLSERDFFKLLNIYDRDQSR